MKTLTEIRDFLNAIPDSEWCTKYYENPENWLQRCALGHINHALCGNPVPQDLSDYGPSFKLLGLLGVECKHIISANNGMGAFSSEGKTPRERVVDFLNTKIEEVA